MNIRTIPTGDYQTNCYLVYDEASKIGAIIDPGFEAQRISEAVKKEGIDVKAIFLTHGHCDHLSAAKDMQELFHVPLWVHKDDLDLVEHCCEQAEMLGLPSCSIPEPNKFFEEGSVVSVGPMDFHVLHTPGHTPGGVTLVVDNQAFCGDTIFNGSVGRTDFTGGDSRTLLETIRQKIYTLPDSTVLHTGHGPDTSVGTEKRTNPFVRGICQ